MKTKLSPQQQRFCDAYLSHGNATKAAIAAGYSWKTANSGYLQKSPVVKRYLEQQRALRVSTAQFDATEVLKQLCAVAFGNIGDFFTGDGTLKPLNELGSDTTAAIKTLEVTTLAKETDKGKTVIKKRTNLKMLDKLRALDRLGKYLAPSAP